MSAHLPRTPRGHRALILTDVQNDFCEGGSLAVAGGTEVARRISGYVLDHADEYDEIVATADWHHDPGGHFAEHPDFVDSWPEHCRVGTQGALFHPAVEPAFAYVRAIFHKGEHSAAYSGFEGSATQEGSVTGPGAGTPDGAGTSLEEWLRDRAVQQVDIVGIATDYCVRATALDAAERGFATTVLLDLTAGVGPTSTDVALTAMRAAGITLVGEPLLS